MLKFCCVFFLGCLLNSTLSAQDLIVTAKGDSINATVSKIKNGYVHFTFNYKGEIRQTLLPRDEIEYREGFYSTAEVPEDQLPEPYSFSRFRVSLLGGLSYLTGRVSEQLPTSLANHIRELKMGSHYGGDVDFFFSELFGLGLRYRLFRTRHENNDIAVLNFQTMQLMRGRLKDDIRIQFIGPALVSHIANSSEKIHVNFGLSAGYVHFKNLGYLIDESVDITSDSYAIAMDLNVEFMLDKNLALGIGGSYTGLFFSSFRYEYESGLIQNRKLDGENRDNWSRFDLSARLTWYMGAL